ncbi:hypothetical protein ABNF97_31355 [Plantactinospora sp. B6F1]|uniref:hypothetical protein n=1 Tax=Plantactinospora sp. B6F1 TaxID=3158971 RepID=UPI0010DE00EA
MTEDRRITRFLEDVESLREDEAVLSTAHTSAVSADGWTAEGRPSDDSTES